MIRLERIQKSFAGQVLFDRVDWFLGDSDHVGLIGRNGTGKSTLLRMIAGDDSPDEGIIAATREQRVGYLPQFGFQSGPGTVLEEARRAFAEILEWKWRLEEIEAELARGSSDPAAAESLLAEHERYDHLFRQHGGYEIERRVHQVLSGLGFQESDFDRPVRALSGGWQMRVALARLLLQRPEVLLLDEPTNHLDIEARVWLEGFLDSYPGGFVIVSHDRHFLDRTVTRVTEIMGRRLVDYDGNYTRFVQQREARYELALKAYRHQQEDIERIQRFIDRNRVRNDRAAQVQSRIKMLEKIERLAPPEPPTRPIHFRFPAPARSGRIVVHLENVAKAYGPLRVFHRLDLDLERGEKVALVGPNGAGKSTLMRILAGTEAADGGRRTVGTNVTLEFFAQDQADQLPQDRSILDETVDRCPVALVPQARSLLGAFLFRGEEVDKRIKVLSGGERNRLALMYMLLTPANLLLLDEPTNHLDIEAQEVLLTALREFNGTVVFVSHDHHFLAHLATRVVEVGQGGARNFPGDYEAYLWKKRQEEAAVAAPEDGRPQNGETGADAGAGRERTIEPRDRGRDERKRQRRVAQIEERIGLLEERREKLEALMATEGFFKDPEKSRFYVEEHQAAGDEINRLYEEWHHVEGEPEPM